MKKFLQDNATYLVWFLFGCGVYWQKSSQNTQEIIRAMDTKVSITALQFWAYHLKENNPQMSVPGVHEAVIESEIRFHSPN